MYRISQHEVHTSKLTKLGHGHYISVRAFFKRLSQTITFQSCLTLTFNIEVMIIKLILLSNCAYCHVQKNESQVVACYV